MLIKCHKLTEAWKYKDSKASYRAQYLLFISRSLITQNGLITGVMKHAWAMTEPAGPSPPFCWLHGVGSCMSFQGEGCSLYTPLQILGKHLWAHLFLQDSFPLHNRRWVLHHRLEEVLRVERLRSFNRKNTFGSNFIIIHCQMEITPS